jgi:hypothetical protein
VHWPTFFRSAEQFSKTGVLRKSFCHFSKNKPVLPSQSARSFPGIWSHSTEVQRTKIEHRLNSRETLTKELIAPRKSIPAKSLALAQAKAKKTAIVANCDQPVSQPSVSINVRRLARRLVSFSRIDDRDGSPIARSASGLSSHLQGAHEPSDDCAQETERARRGKQRSK